jgi:hypothetical protein
MTKVGVVSSPKPAIEPGGTPFEVPIDVPTSREKPKRGGERDRFGRPVHRLQQEQASNVGLHRENTMVSTRRSTLEVRLPAFSQARSRPRSLTMQRKSWWPRRPPTMSGQILGYPTTLVHEHHLAHWATVLNDEPEAVTGLPSTPRNAGGCFACFVDGPAVAATGNSHLLDSRLGSTTPRRQIRRDLVSGPSPPALAVDPGRSESSHPFTTVDEGAGVLLGP